jgi:hypothetical protein
MHESERHNPEREIAEKTELIRKSFPNIPREIPHTSQGSRISEVAVDFTEAEPGRTVVVGTDKAGVVRSDQEVMTRELYGCLGVFIQGTSFNELTHMTPGSSLGYKYHRHPQARDEMLDRNISHMVGILKDKEGELGNSRAVILANIAQEGDHEYGHEEQHRIWEDLRQRLIKAGIPQVKLVELPIDQSAIYYTPQKPNHLYALGRQTGINPDGSYDESQRDTLNEYWVSLDPNESESYGIQRPMSQREAAPPPARESRPNPFPDFSN